MSSLHKTLISALLLMATVIIPAYGDDEPPIVVSIESDSTSVILLPVGLGERLQYQEPAPAPESRPRNGVAGWRVQVFSDNNPRTAKNEARTKESAVASRFPQYRTYRMYKAPYWRLRVGDFRTQREAEAAASEIRRAFPSFGAEIRVVRDRINVGD